MSIQDRIASVHPLRATTAAYAAVSALQTYPPEVQVMAVAMLAHSFTRNLGLDLSQQLNAAERALHDADTYHSPTAGALQSYIRGELKS